MIFDISFAYFHLKAAEQAKASPALVAKDPSTSTNKKEEEDLAKGEEFLSMWLMWPCLHHLNESKTLQAHWWHVEETSAFFNFLMASFCAQLSSSRWKSSVSSPRPPYPASTPAPPACCPRTSLMAGKSAPSMTSKPPRTMSSLSSRERSSPSWTIGDFTVYPPNTSWCEYLYLRLCWVEISREKEEREMKEVLLVDVFVFLISVTQTGGRGKRTKESDCFPPTLSQLISLQSLRWVSKHTHTEAIIAHTNTCATLLLYIVKYRSWETLPLIIKGRV